jgi:PAS domain-containing protein
MPSRIHAVSDASLAMLPLEAGLDSVLESLLSALANGVLLLDADGQLRAINPAARAALGPAAVPRMGEPLPFERLPLSLREFYADGAWPRLGDVWAEMIVGGEARRLCFRIRPLGPQPLWLIELIDATDQQRLTREASVSSQQSFELQQAHEELCCSFEMAETEIERLKEQLQDQAALITELLGRNRTHHAEQTEEQTDA